jgi:hypothetical protein
LAGSHIAVAAFHGRRRGGDNLAAVIIRVGSLAGLESVAIDGSACCASVLAIIISIGFSRNW